MAFTGKYEAVSFEDNEEFWKSIGQPTELATSFAVAQTEILQEGDDFTWSTCSMIGTYTFKFTLNKECEIEDDRGQKFKETATMVAGKVFLQFPRTLFTTELSGDKLIERFTTNGGDGVSIKRVSKRIPPPGCNILQ